MRSKAQRGQEPDARGMGPMLQHATQALKVRLCRAYITGCGFRLSAQVVHPILSMWAKLFISDCGPLFSVNSNTCYTALLRALGEEAYHRRALFTA